MKKLRRLRSIPNALPLTGEVQRAGSPPKRRSSGRSRRSLRGECFDSVPVLVDDPLIRKYQYVQYANVFDELSEEWFRIG